MEPTPWIMRTAGIRRGCRVLDVGCGDGGLARAAVALGADTIGLDLQPHPPRGDGVMYLAADASRMPLRDAAVDVAVSGSVLVWSSRRASIVRETARVLAAGGVWCGFESVNAHLEVITGDDALDGVWRVLRLALDQLQPVTLSSQMLRDLIANNGFDDVEVEQVPSVHDDWDPHEFFFDLRGPDGFSLAEYWHAGGIPSELISGWVEGVSAKGAKLGLSQARFRASRP